MVKVRYPVATNMYSSDPTALKSQLKGFATKVNPDVEYPVSKRTDETRRKIIGGVAPHAGYVFSGLTAMRTLGSFMHEGAPDTFILIGLFHSGMPIISTMANGFWETPLGRVEIDSELAETILSSTTTIIDDEKPHRNEHSIEVEIPFLQFLYSDFTILPIGIGTHDFKSLEKTAQGIVDGIQALNRDAVIIASTDMTHYGMGYGSAPVGGSSASTVLEYMKNTDAGPITDIESLHAQDLLEHVTENRISMCGVAPVTTALIIAKLLGVTKTESLEYTTSYEVYGGSLDHVVGYYSGIFRRP